MEYIRVPSIEKYARKHLTIHHMQYTLVLTHQLDDAYLNAVVFNPWVT